MTAPPPSAPTVLFVDDEAANRRLFAAQFGGDYQVLLAEDGLAALDILETHEVHLVVTDERMPGLSGVDLLSQVVARWPDVGRIIVSAYRDADVLLRAIQCGHAEDFMCKPWAMQELGDCLSRHVESVQRRRSLARRAELADRLIEDEHSRSGATDVIVGADGHLRELLDASRRAALTATTVLITGETGTGKELIARYVHENSRRRSKPFVRVNCGALTESLLESELFGHEKGAFTGASQQRKGRFELADGGTLFLDEIGEVSPKLQVSLLRVLQERCFERVGGAREVHVDVRVVAATHVDLEAEVAAGRFRKDLFYRLNVIPLHIPPLRSRPEDIGPLIRHLISKHASLLGLQSAPAVTDDVVEAARRYPWPGNVRELENLVQRALALNDGPELGLEAFAFDLGAPTVATQAREQAADQQRREVAELLQLFDGNCTRAARALGVPRTTFISRAKKHGLL